MGLTTTILRSRAVAALTSPARRRPLPRAGQPDVGRPRGPGPHRRRPPRGRRPRPPAGRHDHPAAHLDLAGPPRRPARPARRRGRRRPPYDAGLHDLQPRLPPRRPVHGHAARQPGRRRLAVPRRARRARHDGPPLAGAGRVRAARPGARARAVHLRRLRHHPGDVDAALAAAPHPPRPGHLHALRAEPRAPDLRRRARRRSAAPATASTCTCCTPSSATRTCRRRTSSGWCPGYRDVPDLGAAARRR